MAEEYLTISEVAARLKLKPKTLRNKMASGDFIKGEHYHTRKGMRPRFVWSKVVVWLEQAQKETPEEASDPIPMAHRYRLGEPGKKNNFAA